MGGACHSPANTTTRNDSLGKTVAAKTIKAMHIPAGRFTDSVQAMHVISLTVSVNANATHRVVLSGAYRD